MKEGRKPEYREKNPDDELHKVKHMKARKFKPQPRFEPAFQHWWQSLSRQGDMLTITPCVALVRLNLIFNRKELKRKCYQITTVANHQISFNQKSNSSVIIIRLKE